MKKSEQLFFLIKSLTKAERRYFTLFCGAENKVYRQLFEAIRNQDHYDEKAIREQFRDEAFTRQLTSAKYYLKNLLLKALRNYHSKLSADAEIKDLLRNTEILYHKGLYQSCRVELRRARNLAEKHEKLATLFEIGEWERRITALLQPRQRDALRAVVDGQAAKAREMATYAEAWQHNLSPNDFKPYPVAAGQPLQTFTMQLLFQYQKQFFTGNTAGAANFLLKIIRRYEGNPHRLREDPGLYLNVLNNLIAFLLFEKKTEEALQVIARVKTFIASFRHPSIPLEKTLFRTLNIELEMYRDLQDFQRAETLMKEIEQARPKQAMPLTYQLSFWFQFANIYFLQKKYDQAIPWINQLLNHPRRDAREDLVTHAQWLNLMIHFEMKNYFVLRYFVEGLRRYLKKRKKILPYEKRLLNFFGTCIRLPDAEVPGAFQQLYQQFTTDPEYSIPGFDQGYLDFLGWIGGKFSLQ